MKLYYEFGGSDSKRGKNFAYEVDYKQIKAALQECERKMLFSKITDIYSISEFKKEFETDIENCLIDELVEIVTEIDLEDEFEEYLTDYFFEDAKENYDDCKAYADDPYAYNGVRQSDFM